MHLRILQSLSDESQHGKTYLRTCAPSEDSDQPAHSRSLIRIFTERILDSQGCKVSSCRVTKALVYYNRKYFSPLRSKLFPFKERKKKKKKKNVSIHWLAVVYDTSKVHVVTSI